MNFKANIFQTQPIFTQETITSGSINVTETSNEAKEAIKNLENKVDILTNEVGSLKQIMCKQTVLLEQLAKHLRPTSTDLKIFPINSLEELNSAEQLIKTEPDSEVISYIKLRFDKIKTEKALRKMIGENMLLKLNWDGSRNMIALNKYKLFNFFISKHLKARIQHTQNMKDLSSWHFVNVRQLFTDRPTRQKLQPRRIQQNNVIFEKILKNK